MCPFNNNTPTVNIMLYASGIQSTPHELCSYGHWYRQYIPTYIYIYIYIYIYMGIQCTKMNCRRFGLPFWFVDVLVCRRFGLSTLRFVNVSVCRRFVFSTFRFVDVLVCRRVGLSSFWFVDVWFATFRFVDVLTSYRIWYRRMLYPAVHFTVDHTIWKIVLMIDTYIHNPLHFIKGKGWCMIDIHLASSTNQKSR